jgi:thiamine-phosphate pyrophosphorylase
MHYQLPSRYYFINTFDTNLINKQDQGTAIIYRNYKNLKIEKELILKIKNICKKKKIKFFIANNIKLAVNLNLDGAYIPSFNKNFSHLSYDFKKNFLLIGSAHNLKEIRIKELQKVQAIFISSLFKRNKNYLGVNRFKLISNLTKKIIVALGGISKENLKKIKLTKCSLFAGISFFG